MSNAKIKLNNTYELEQFMKFWVTGFFCLKKYCDTTR